MKNTDGGYMNYKHGQKLSTFIEALRALADGEKIIDQLGTIWECGERFHKTVRSRKLSVHTLCFLQWPMTIHRLEEEKKKVLFCPVCKLNHYSRERCLNGKTTCLNCNFSCASKHWDYLCQKESEKVKINRGFGFN